jgi:hypothetical protein
LPGLDIRLGMTDEIVKGTLPKPVKKNGGHDHPDVVRWKALQKRVQDQLAIRRQIAHQEVYVTLYANNLDKTGDLTENSELQTEFNIYAGQHERMRAVGSPYVSDYPGEGLTVDNLKLHQETVAAISGDLRTFVNEVLPRHTSTPPQPNLPQSPETVAASALAASKAIMRPPEPSPALSQTPADVEGKGK